MEFLVESPFDLCKAISTDFLVRKEPKIIFYDSGEGRCLFFLSVSLKNFPAGTLYFMLSSYNPTPSKFLLCYNDFGSFSEKMSKKANSNIRIIHINGLPHDFEKQEFPEEKILEWGPLIEISANNIEHILRKLKRSFFFVPSSRNYVILLQKGSLFIFDISKTNAEFLGKYKQKIINVTGLSFYYI